MKNKYYLLFIVAAFYIFIESSAFLVNNTYYKLTSDLLLSGVDPLMIAGVMTAAGMQLYKQTMTTEEFNRIKREIMKVEI